MAVIALPVHPQGLLHPRATIAVLFAIVFHGRWRVGLPPPVLHRHHPSGHRHWVPSFSTLEVVLLALIGFEAYHTVEQGDAVDGQVRWPIRFFLAVSFWNLVGAGLFGFLINAAALCPTSCRA